MPKAFPVEFRNDVVAVARKRGLSRKAGPPVHDDLVDRDFTAPAANVT